MLCQLAFFFGTFAPFLRASERPMAIACLRLVTLPPLPPFPARSGPAFSPCIALLTLSASALPYFAIAFLLFVLLFLGFEPLHLSVVGLETWSWSGEHKSPSHCDQSSRRYPISP